MINMIQNNENFLKIDELTQKLKEKEIEILKIKEEKELFDKEAESCQFSFIA